MFILSAKRHTVNCHDAIRQCILWCDFHIRSYRLLRHIKTDLQFCGHVCYYSSTDIKWPKFYRISRSTGIITTTTMNVLKAAINLATFTLQFLMAVNFRDKGDLAEAIQARCSPKVTSRATPYIVNVNLNRWHYFGQVQPDTVRNTETPVLPSDHPLRHSLDLRVGLPDFSLWRGRSKKSSMPLTSRSTPYTVEGYGGAYEWIIEEVRGWTQHLSLSSTWIQEIHIMNIIPNHNMEKLDDL